MTCNFKKKLCLFFFTGLIDSAHWPFCFLEKAQKMNNVVFFDPICTNVRKPPSDASRRLIVSKFPVYKHAISGDLLDVAKAHGFLAYAVLEINERRQGLVFPKMSFHGLGKELGVHISSVPDLTNCSVFLMLSETNAPFPFTTGYDCRDNTPSDPGLLDNQLDTLLNMFGIQGGYCVPVSAPDGTRNVVMYFGPREEFYSRYPNLVLDTIESFDAIWHERRERLKRVYPALTTREIECLRGFRYGKKLNEIGEEIGLSEHSVKAYCMSAMTKLAAVRLIDAVTKGIEMGLL